MASRTDSNDFKNRKKRKVVTAEIASSTPHLLRAPRTTNTPINDRRMIPSELNDAMRKLSDCLIENTQYAMESQGMTWSSLSHNAGLSTSTIYPIKNRRTNVGTAAACQIAVALGLSIEDTPRLYLPHAEFVDFYSARAVRSRENFFINVAYAMAFHDMKWKEIADQWEFESSLLKSLQSGKIDLDTTVATKITKALFVESHDLENMFKVESDFIEFYTTRMMELSVNVTVNINATLESLGISWNQLLKESSAEKQMFSKLKSGEACVGLGVLAMLSKTLGLDDIGPAVLYFEHGRFSRIIATRRASES